MFNRRNFLGLASVTSFIGGAPAAIAAVISAQTTLTGEIGSLKVRARTFKLTSADYYQEVKVKVPKNVRIRLQEGKKSTVVSFRKLKEASEEGWDVTVKGKLNSSETLLRARRVTIVVLEDYGYGGY